MNNNYSERLQNLKRRYNPENDYLSKSFQALDSSKLSYINTSDEYVRSAMSAVDDKFTSDIKQAGDNVKTHLQRTLTNVNYEFQGSVMTDTHIKANSDIDLLTISNQFYHIPSINELQNLLQSNTLNNPQKETVQNILNTSFFAGNANNILLENRLKSEEILQEKYKECDISKPKCVHIYNSDLRKYVDIVIASYDDDIFSIKNLREKKFRGIKVYEKNVGTGKTDHPFFTIDSINTKSALAHGRLKKMIRFLKNFMYDSSNPYNELKSFGVNIICYGIDVNKYSSLHYVGLLFVIQEQLEKIISDFSYMSSLTSIDGSEKLFYDKDGNFLINKYHEVVQLKDDLNELLNEIYFNFKNAI